MAEKRKLGRGLDAIFGNNLQEVLQDIEQTSTSSTSQELPIAQIRVNPYQPRKSFDQEKLQELAESIRLHGVFQPILVRKALRGYELISGERRTRASKLAGKTTIPAIVVDFNEQQMMEIALLENIQREDLSAIEEAKAYQALISKLNYTQEQLAKQVGKSRVHITNTMRLLKLPSAVQQYVVDGQLSHGAARAILALEDEQQILDLANRCIKEGLSVRYLEQYIQQLKKPVIKKEKKLNPSLQYVREICEKKLHTKVEVSAKKLIVHYQDTKDLNRILDILNLIED